MANREVIKVFHAARQDVEIIWHQAKLIPQPIFDTQVAAMVLGYGDSISYDQRCSASPGISSTNRTGLRTGRSGRCRTPNCAMPRRT